MSDATPPPPPPPPLLTTLAARLARGPLSAKEATYICRTLLSTLEKEHARGMAHGSITAETIVFEQGPPTLRGFHAASAGEMQDDLYALALVFQDLVTNRRWPRRARRAVLRALAADPADRFPDAASFQRALWVPRPTPLVWPAVAVLAFALVLIGAISFCNPLGLCPERSYDLMIMPFAVEAGGRPAFGARLASAAAQRLVSLPSFTVVPGSVAVRMWQDSIAGRELHHLRFAARAGGSVVERPNLLLVRLEVWDSLGKPRFSTAFSTRPGVETEMVDSVVVQLLRWLRPDLVQPVRTP
jgi:hypothetical protein